MPGKLLNCSICHQPTYPPYNLAYETHVIMAEEKLCAACAGWVSYSRYKDCYLIDGVAYILQSLEQVNTPAEVRRNSYRQFFYNTKNLKLFAADVINVGKVSKECRGLFKRNYLKPIGAESAKRLAAYEGDRCRSKGCFDRYCCVLYDKSVERRDGAWNRVPDNWVPGGEDCPSFINKSTTIT